MNFDNYSLTELVEIKKKLDDKISTLENSLLKELRDKIRPLIFTDEEWKLLNKNEREIYDLYYHEGRWDMVGCGGDLTFNTYKDWTNEEKEIKGNYNFNKYVASNERNMKLLEAKKKNPLFFTVAKRLRNLELNKIMEQYEDSGLDMIRLVDCYYKVE